MVNCKRAEIEVATVAKEILRTVREDNIEEGEVKETTKVKVKESKMANKEDLIAQEELARVEKVRRGDHTAQEELAKVEKAKKEDLIGQEELAKVVKVKKEDLTDQEETAKVVSTEAVVVKALSTEAVEAKAASTEAVEVKVVSTEAIVETEEETVKVREEAFEVEMEARTHTLQSTPKIGSTELKASRVDQRRRATVS